MTMTSYAPTTPARVSRNGDSELTCGLCVLGASEGVEYLLGVRGGETGRLAGDGEPQGGSSQYSKATMAAMRSVGTNVTGTPACSFDILILRNRVLFAYNRSFIIVVLAIRDLFSGRIDRTGSPI